MMDHLSEASTNSVRNSSEGRQSIDSDNPWQLKLSDAKLANIKSPCFLKLEAMISTLDKFRSEMDGQRVAKFEIEYLKKKKKDHDRMMKEQRRAERKAKKA